MVCHTFLLMVSEKEESGLAPWAGHPGQHRTMALLGARSYWPQMKAEKKRLEHILQREARWNAFTP